ncbi:Lrp/AsnC family transcriptional regulator [Candidatus Woesearchaeota archaeon]|nr:Lrp/AsnC family transcriptional regulator [Candidatus Woesearchaeota archaeon]
MKIDNTDRDILRVLKENSKLSYRGIAKKLLMPTTTVHHRVRKLENEGIIKGYSVVIDNEKLGNIICAYILLKVDYLLLNKGDLTQKGLAAKIKQRSDVEDVAMVTGGVDIILKIRTTGVDMLNKLITEDLRKIEGVSSTETLLVLDELDKF